MEATTVSLQSLTPEQRSQLLKDLEREQRESRDRVREERASYKHLVDETVMHLFPKLQAVSAALEAVKKEVFDEFDALVKLKAELYGRGEDQFTHQFSSFDGSTTIMIGRNVTDKWDDTVNTGIAKANDYIKSLAKDDNSSILVKNILRLMSKDSKGNLNASKVLLLRQMAEEIGNKEFIDAIQIIQDAYRPTPSKEYVRVEYRAPNGDKAILPLSITEVNMPQENGTEK